MLDGAFLWWTLLAQALPETAVGWAGWASLPPLLIVLGWLLLKYLPAKDTQIESIIRTKDLQLEARDKQIQGLIERSDLKAENLTRAYQQESEKLREVFTSSLVSIREHCEHDTNKLVEGMNRIWEGMQNEFRVSRDRRESDDELRGVGQQKVRAQ